MSSEEKTNAIFKMWTPKAVTDTYEPGSVFKLITSSIGLEENLVDTDVPNTFNCTGYFYVKGEEEPIRCHRYYNPHRQQTLREAHMNSCNPAFMNLEQKLVLLVLTNIIKHSDYLIKLESHFQEKVLESFMI